SNAATADDRCDRAVGQREELADELAAGGSAPVRVPAGVVQCLASPRRGASAGGAAGDDSGPSDRAVVAMAWTAPANALAVDAREAVLACDGAVPDCGVCGDGI